MYAVGMLGSYLTQGVYAVAGPFQPFGGAVDIIVVQQEDGTFKSSPWYVKFGDYQSPFKTRTREKAVDISVNDVPADFHMFLDYNGEAYFEKEIDVDEESIGSQASGAFLSSEGGSISDAATEREVSETNNLWVHEHKDAFSNPNLRSSAVQDISIAESSFGSSSLDNFHNESEGKKSNEVQEASNALSVDVLSEGERCLSVSTTEMNGVGVSNMHGILIAESSHEVFGKMSSANSTEILETTETHSIGYTDSTVNFLSSGNSLSVLQTQESNSTYMEMENTHNNDLIKTFDLNTESQENQSESDLWGKSQSDSVLGAAGINNESNTFTTIVNDNRNLDTEDGAVFIDFKSTDTESDVAAASYDFRRLILEEREEWSVGNVRKNELSTDESEGVVQESESIDTDVKISVIIPSSNEQSGVESSELEKQVEVEQVSEEASQHEGQQIAASSVSSSFRWSLWPLSFRRSRLEKVTSADSNHAMLATTSITAEFPPPEELTQNNDWPQKTKVRTYVPTSSQLASLNLKDGPNKVTFKTIFGKTEVDARIYLWKWNARIVISDVDGTITKSDVLGQVMPLVGRDWSQYGVTRLFSAIKDNGFQVLFLSARAISQAYLTRKFLLTLKQDGEALPEGPVFISPDGLFPSLYREVIRRAPHEFKISCLEAIRELFPKDVNPFYAGFGNRITDEISYLKVGIPKGKIFIINPKGEVVVDRRVDHKSYTSLHALVDDMFPPMSSHEQVYSWRTSTHGTTGKCHFLILKRRLVGKAQRIRRRQKSRHKKLQFNKVPINRIVSISASTLHSSKTV